MLPAPWHIGYTEHSVFLWRACIASLTPICWKVSSPRLGWRGALSKPREYLDLTSPPPRSLFIRLVHPTLALARQPRVTSLVTHNAVLCCIQVSVPQVGIPGIKRAEEWCVRGFAQERARLPAVISALNPLGDCSRRNP